MYGLFIVITDTNLHERRQSSTEISESAEFRVSINQLKSVIIKKINGLTDKHYIILTTHLPGQNLKRSKKGIIRRSSLNQSWVTHGGFWTVLAKKAVTTTNKRRKIHQQTCTTRKQRSTQREPTRCQAQTNGWTMYSLKQRHIHKM